MFCLKIFNVDDSLKNGMQMGAEIMTLEMRYREKREEGKIYGIISACRECNISEERILTPLYNFSRKKCHTGLSDV